MTTYRAIILGDIWQPGVGLCSTERTYTLDGDDDKQAIEAAYTSEAGDFSSVKDVRVLTRQTCQGTGCLPHAADRLVKDWDNEDNEMEYLDTIREEWE